jgi:hypothetical protein
VEPGTGPSAERSLRVSAATLARVEFPHPNHGILMVALEHKATVNPSEKGLEARVHAQPFGGAVRLLRLAALYERLGGFNFDSVRSRSEQDLRLFIQPASWPDLMAVCRRALQTDPPLIEVDPSRELREEFADSLAVELLSDQFSIERSAVLVERQPSPTANLRAAGQPTARIYWTHKVTILDEGLCQLIAEHSERQSAADLGEAALADAQGTGWGRANGIFLAPLVQIEAAYQAVPSQARAEPLPFADTWLAGNVPAVLDGVTSPRYERLEETP